MSVPTIQKLAIEPRYRKDNGMFVLDIDLSDETVGFSIKERSVVSIPPEQIGGNHIHPRAEAFVGMGEDLHFHWLDETGTHHEELMNPTDQLFLFLVPSQVPHAIENRSTTLSAVMLEYASDSQSREDVTHVQVVQ